jgi:hypothetical protein
VIPSGALKSPPWDGMDIRLAMLEDRVREAEVELRDHRLRFRELAERGK